MGIQQEDTFQRELEAELGIRLVRSKTNEDEPDLIEPLTSTGMEVKKRSGEYETTSYHVRNQMMPKFYLGEWKEVRGRNGISRRIFIPLEDSNGKYVPKPRWRNAPKYVIMSKIAAPTRAASKLLQKLKIQIVTLWEMKRILNQPLNPKTRKAVTSLKQHLQAFHSFSPMPTEYGYPPTKTDIPYSNLTPTPKYNMVNHFWRDHKVRSSRTDVLPHDTTTLAKPYRISRIVWDYFSSFWMYLARVSDCHGETIRSCPKIHPIEVYSPNVGHIPEMCAHSDLCYLPNG